MELRELRIGDVVMLKENKSVSFVCLVALNGSIALNGGDLDDLYTCTVENLEDVKLSKGIMNQIGAELIRKDERSGSEIYLLDDSIGFNGIYIELTDDGKCFLFGSVVSGPKSSVRELQHYVRDNCGIDLRFNGDSLIYNGQFNYYL